MIHNVLEEWFDTLLYVGSVIGLIVFFCIYWGNEYASRHAEAIMYDFLNKASMAGKITEEEYIGLKNRLYDIYPGFILEISCSRQLKQPVYDLIPKEKLEVYFTDRNVKAQKELKEYEMKLFQMDADELCFQTETNASVLAADQKEYLPLPREESQVLVCAARSSQEVYAGEKLITLCRVTDSEGVYYKEAAYTEAWQSGKVLLELSVGGVNHQVPVEVICHPRIVKCDMGHDVVNTREVIEVKRVTGKISCPYCSILPERMTATEPELYLATGEILQNGQISVFVTYLDGTTEYISPGSQDWQDDFDSNYCGTQEVTIRYRNMETKITVVSENPPCKKCGGECNDRNYKDYIQYPYCLVCLSEMFLFTGEERGEEVLVSQKEMINELESKGEILFNRGDFLMIMCKRGTNMSVLQRKIRIDGKTK